MPSVTARRALASLLAGLMLTGVPHALADSSGGGGETAPTSSSRSLEAFERGQKLFDAARAYQAERPADRAGVSERYRLAGEEFVAAWKAGATSTEVLTNAANCFAFAGLVGPAVLYYRRALAVDPTERRARDGLEFLRASLPIRRSVSTSTSLLRTLFFWHDGLAFRTRQLLFFVLFPTGFLFFIVALWRRRPFFLLGIIVIVPALALLASLLTDALGRSLTREGVIQVEVEGRRGDGATYGPSHSMPLPAGTEVSVVSESKGAGEGASWLNVRLLDDSESWVPASAVERVLITPEREKG